MAERELDAYKKRMEGGKSVPFIPGDDKADYTDEKGKQWLAKKNETKDDLVKRAHGQKIASKTPPEGDSEGES